MAAETRRKKASQNTHTHTQISQAGQTRDDFSVSEHSAERLCGRAGIFFLAARPYPEKVWQRRKKESGKLVGSFLRTAAVTLSVGRSQVPLALNLFS